MLFVTFGGTTAATKTIICSLRYPISISSKKPNQEIECQANQVTSKRIVANPLCRWSVQFNCPNCIDALRSNARLFSLHNRLALQFIGRRHRQLTNCLIREPLAICLERHGEKTARTTFPNPMIPVTSCPIATIPTHL